MKDMQPAVAPGVGKFDISLQCGDCQHFRGSKHPSMTAPCSQLGIGAKSTSPSCYTPDITAFKSFSQEAFRTLAALMMAMTPRQARILMGTLRYAGTLDKHGFSFLEEVYFSTDPAYLDNYFKGYIIGIGKGGECIIVGTDYLKCSKSSTFAYMDKSSLLSKKSFIKRRDELIDRGMIKSPKVIKLVKANAYEVPTIDNEPTGEDKVVKKRKLVIET